MTWAEACEDPILRDLPFKIELNRWGQVVMSPAKNNHAFLQGKVATLLGRLLQDGQVSVEQPVETADGVKVPDVSWVSPALYERLKGQDTSDVAPEICVEVVSPSNIAEQMKEKRQLYFERGAREVWLANAHTRRVTFFGPGGPIVRSALCPDFPAMVPE